MGVIIKYLIDFLDTGLKVSNDLFAATVLLDAEVKVDMRRGSAGTQFEIKLFDLPHSSVAAIEAWLATKQPFRLKATLGYMDTFTPSTDFVQVVEGLFTKIKRKVETNREVTTIEGKEKLTHKLTEAKVDFALDASATAKTAVDRVLELAGIAATESAVTGLDGTTMANRRFSGRAIDVLDEISYAAEAELIVGDGKVRVGKPINDDTYVRSPYSVDSNLAEFRPFTKALPAENDTSLPQPTPAADATGFRFAIAGDPKLRPAHAIRVDVQADGYEGTTFRVHTLVHALSLEGGYVCEGIALKPCSTDACRRQQDAIGQPTAVVVADAINRRIKGETQARPPIEVAAVKEYVAGSSSQTPHRATLYFGQQFLRGETQPSIRTAVLQDEEKLFRTKPMVSPFAWYKCGLVVPVYKGMKAVLGHNLNLKDDALVTGFVWSETPAFPPPASTAGDWWLCLPVGLGPNDAPSDSAKASNDLTASNGHRTIQAKGLRIMIGDSKLVTVGTRPAEATADELFIEHAQAQIKILSSGTIELSAGGPTLRITSSGVEIA